MNPRIHANPPELPGWIDGAPMDTETFERFRRIVQEESGIALCDGKEMMVAARISKRMRSLQLRSPEAYLAYLINDKSGDEAVHLVDAISTNVTGFFREPDHFLSVARAMAKWLAAGQRRFRFWSTASSTGEEPYTLAMVVQEACRGQDVDARILATDISTRVLKTASAGRYTLERVRQVPHDLKMRYFTVGRDRDGQHVTVKPVLRRMVVFRQLNLSQFPYPMRGPLDIVFCRNVMIYFSADLRNRIVGEIKRLLKPRGLLITGHAEGLSCMSSGFKVVRPSVYLR